MRASGSVAMTTLEGIQTQERLNPHEGLEEMHSTPRGTRARLFFFVALNFAVTCGVDGDPVDASVFGLELLQENPHAVAERLQGELAALSPGRQTDRDHRQPVLVHHRHLCSQRAAPADRREDHESHMEETVGSFSSNYSVVRNKAIIYNITYALCLSCKGLSSADGNTLVIAIVFFFHSMPPDPVNVAQWTL